MRQKNCFDSSANLLYHGLCILDVTTTPVLEEPYFHDLAEVSKQLISLKNQQNDTKHWMQFLLGNFRPSYDHCIGPKYGCNLHICQPLITVIH